MQSMLVNKSFAGSTLEHGSSISSCHFDKIVTSRIFSSLFLYILYIYILYILVLKRVGYSVKNLENTMLSFNSHAPHSLFDQ